MAETLRASRAAARRAGPARRAPACNGAGAASAVNDVALQIERDEAHFARELQHRATIEP